MELKGAIQATTLVDIFIHGDGLRGEIDGIRLMMNYYLWSF